MSYKTYLIECDYVYTTGVIITALQDLEETYQVSYINQHIVCVDSFSSLNELYNLLVIDLDLTLGISELNMSNFNKTMFPYNTLIRNQVKDFIREVEISEDINYFLDLIIDRGGINHLSLKEYQRLEELSK